jgi:hypothetical protein
MKNALSTNHADWAVETPQLFLADGGFLRFGFNAKAQG